MKPAWSKVQAQVPVATWIPQPQLWLLAMGWALGSGFWQRGDATHSPEENSWGMVFGSRTG